ncbi:MAG: tRNA lysidine(34) synthetase TilS [Candidatus Gracilibacteria bacterium]|nr:tRNA lysidine(34) synthetase TilS [Candidatus Gracilibacteria bacterium]
MLSSFFQKYHITPNDTLIIACSGGPDSMYLLLESMKSHDPKHLVVAHFNHSLRGIESDEDEIFLREFCMKHSLVFESEKKDIAKIAESLKKSIEETARIERYAFLERVREKYSQKSPEKQGNVHEDCVSKGGVLKSTMKPFSSPSEPETCKIGMESSRFAEIFILTAHHLDDSIETFMFHLIRGTKIQGLTGVPEQNGHILRPLLSIQKKEILQSLDRDSISYRLDSTNADDAYLRNHLRLNIVSQFERINPEYRKNLGAFMEYAKEVASFIETQVEIFLRGETSFSVEDFQVLSPFMQREVFRYLYARANNGTIGLSEGAIAEMIRFTQDKGNYTRKDLGKLHLEKRNFRVYSAIIISS